MRLSQLFVFALAVRALACAQTVAFVQQQGSANHIFLMTVDPASGLGANAIRLTTDAEAENYPTWSPDGKRLLYARDYNGSAIYTIYPDGTGQQRLSPTPGFDVTPSWSPDGTAIVYARLYSAPQPDKPPMTDIRAMNADGTGDHSILANTLFSVEPRWSVNNQIVFMSLMAGGGNLQVFTMNPDGSGLTQLTNAGINGDPVWSPDGTRITFGSDRQGSGKLNLFIMNADGTGQTPLTGFDPPYEAGDSNWSNDGNKIIFQWDINGIKQSDPNAYAEVWTMNSDGTGAMSTGIPCSDSGCSPRWQPKPPPALGTQMVFMSHVLAGGANVYELSVMNLDGSNRQQLTIDGKTKELPHFSPDGTRLLYTKYSFGDETKPDARSDLALYDLASGKETLLTNTGLESKPVWSPDGQRIAWLSSSSGPFVQLKVMNADGSAVQTIASASSDPANHMLGDPAWSSDGWIVFVVVQNASACFKTRLDKVRSDGTARTQVTDGGPNCTPPGLEQNGDADPAFSPDGQTIYTSRGFPRGPAGAPASARLTERRLYAVSSGAWYPGKPETDLSLASQPDCIEGVPKASPDGTSILLFRACFDASPASGIFLTDTAGSYRLKVADGFGPDWNPAYGSVVTMEPRQQHHRGKLR